MASGADVAEGTVAVTASSGGEGTLATRSATMPACPGPLARPRADSNRRARIGEPSRRGLLPARAFPRPDGRGPTMATRGLCSDEAATVSMATSTVDGRAGESGVRLPGHSTTRRECKSREPANDASSRRLVNNRITNSPNCQCSGRVTLIKRSGPNDCGAAPTDSLPPHHDLSVDGGGDPSNLGSGAVPEGARNLSRGRNEPDERCRREREQESSASSSGCGCAELS